MHTSGPARSPHWHFENEINRLVKLLQAERTMWTHTHTNTHTRTRITHVGGRLPFDSSLSQLGQHDISSIRRKGPDGSVFTERTGLSYPSKPFFHPSMSCPFSNQSMISKTMLLVSHQACSHSTKADDQSKCDKRLEMRLNIDSPAMMPKTMYR